MKTITTHNDITIFIDTIECIDWDSGKYILFPEIDLEEGV